MDAINKSAFGFQVYAKPYLKRLSKYGNRKERIEYEELEPEKGSYVDWLNSVTCISKASSHNPVKEVDCNECTAKLFVDMIKSICKINEQIKDFFRAGSDQTNSKGESKFILTD